MKRSLLILLSLALVLCFAACTKTPDPAPSTAPAAPAEGRGEIITTASPDAAGTPEATPKPTPAPAPTFEPAPEGSQPTAVPIPEATLEPGEGAPEAPEVTPAPAPVEGNVDVSGSFRSDTGTALNLVADWREVSVSSDTVKLTVTLSLESYSLDVGDRRNNTLTFNGETYSFTTTPILVEEGFHKTAICTWEKEVPAGSLGFTLSARWELLGSYSGKEMEAIELSGSYRP
jgi:hypothetical protein